MLTRVHSLIILKSIIWVYSFLVWRDTVMSSHKCTHWAYSLVYCEYTYIVCDMNSLLSSHEHSHWVCSWVHCEFAHVTCDVIFICTHKSFLTEYTRESIESILIPFSIKISSSQRSQYRAPSRANFFLIFYFLFWCFVTFLPIFITLRYLMAENVNLVLI